jgi:hypothetical protein
MAAGDAQRVWFPEMLETLLRTWSPSMTWEELAELCASMTERRRAIRQARGIEPPRIRCRKCGAISQSDISGVTIRSALFALKKAGVIDETELAALDKGWQKHRARNRLDACGRKMGPS